MKERARKAISKIINTCCGPEVNEDTFLVTYFDHMWLASAVAIFITMMHQQSKGDQKVSKREVSSSIAKSITAWPAIMIVHFFICFCKDCKATKNNC